MRPDDALTLIGQLRAAVVGAGPSDRRALATRLASLTGHDWLLVDRLARRSTWDRPAPMHGVEGWTGPGLDESTGVVVTAAALHVDGRTREAATRLLAGKHGPVASSVIGLRLLDHVPQVRATARRAAAGVARADRPAVLDVLVSSRGRHAPAELAWLVETWGPSDDEVVAAVSDVRRPAVRRWAFSSWCERGLARADDLVEVADHDPDLWLRRQAVDRLLATAPPAALLPLLDSRSAEARLGAVTAVPDDLLETDRLARLLLDRSPRVREQARWRARRRGTDLAASYRAHVLPTSSPRVLAVALEGLARLGEDGGLAVPFLDHPRPRVRAMALTSAATSTDDADLASLAGPRLLDPAPRVAQAAASVLLRSGPVGASVLRGPVEAAWVSAYPSARRAAWRVCREPGGWERVGADLRLAADPDPVLAGLGRDGLRSWLRHGAASTWHRPSDPRFADWLTQAPVADSARRMIGFHAGLPAYRSRLAVSRTGPSDPTPPRPPRRPWWRRRA